MHIAIRINGKGHLLTTVAKDIISDENSVAIEAQVIYEGDSPNMIVDKIELAMRSGAAVVTIPDFQKTPPPLHKK